MNDDWFSFQISFQIYTRVFVYSRSYIHIINISYILHDNSFYLYDNSVCNEVPIFNNFQGKKVINNIFIESLILLCISWNLYLRNNWWIQILSSLHTTKMSNKLRTDTRVNKVSLLLRRVPFMLNSLLNKTKYKPINGNHYWNFLWYTMWMKIIQFLGKKYKYWIILNPHEIVLPIDSKMSCKNINEKPRRIISGHQNSWWNW